jgi:hypothetical protein
MAASIKVFSGGAMRPLMAEIAPLAPRSTLNFGLAPP